MQGRLHSQEAKWLVADHCISMLAVQGQRLTTDFTNPDWIVVCETLGTEAGVALLDRGLHLA